MTTLMMPSDYGAEMYLGSSPVLTSGYLTSQPFIHDYTRLTPLQTASTTFQANPIQASPLQSFWSSGSQSCGVMVTGNSFRNPLDSNHLTCSSAYANGVGARNSFRSRSRRSPSKKKLDTLTLQPIKSCLVARQDEGEYEQLGAVSPTRLKKKVVFADTQGHPLTEIRVLTERPDCPPRWTADFLEQVTGGAKPEAVTDQWELAFAQPASNYIGMKARLERDNVCVENVIIKEPEGVISGTVKVRNLSYNKTVKVRFTINSWTSYEDVEAVYVPSRGSATGASYDIYDTFSFSIPLPVGPLADKIEFCVCFNSDFIEYWDNNNNKNYVVVSFRPKTIPLEGKPKDVYDVQIDEWSEFASWTHLNISDSPYW
ncbi:Protein phosphatase 1 regulatory subunit 3C [Chionoecetes opilio]|uniref:Protein phosphatase 1 regulatory subunit 3C n=1 Tax=Chionoecetes opilio TaxID=41210 RepID=A0A8J4Y438_CHIOP|nr:Protein phosphatase 1 regulatory subunit 3C [Chionoecetes opilio]